MPNISRITLPTGTTYDIKDEVARQAVAGGTKFLGITTTVLTDGASTSPIVINGENVNAINGGIAIYESKEFIYSTSDDKWHEIGDTSNLGDLAFKDSASGNFTPSGSVEIINGTAYVAESATGGGSVTAGSAASCTLPTLTTSVVNETLTISWSAGSFSANTPTAVTLPSFSEAQPTFTGTQGTVTVS